jgi:DNA-binding transcriptional LysR family regulator
MELRHLRYFVAVAETGNFTRAAELSFVAQSALSQQVAALEKELGNQLFHRTSRAVTLTEAGAVLLPLARRILGDVELAKMEMDALAGVQRGKLRLGLIQTAGTEVDVIGVIGAFHRRYPGIEFDITDRPSGPLVAGITAGDLDVAVVGLGAAELPEGVGYLSLVVEPLVAIVAATSPLAARDRLTVPELVEAGTFIQFTRTSGLRQQVDNAFIRAGLPPAESFELGHVRDMVRMAGSGVGVTIVPRADAVDAQKSGQTSFAMIALADAEALHPVGLIWNRARFSPAAAAFVEEFRATVHR